MARIRSIILATDFSALAQAAAARASLLAREDAASIHLVHAVEMPLVPTPPHMAPMPAAVWERVREAAMEKLEEARKAIEANGISKVTAELAQTSDPVEAIRVAAKEHAADLIVMGTHGHGGIKRAFLGSVAERTLRTIDLPVLAVKEDVAKAAEPIRRILLAVDFSPHSDHAVEVAADLAKRLSASLDVVHAFELPRDYSLYATSFAAELEEKVQQSAGEMLEQIRTRLQKRKLSVTLHTRRGHPSVAIAEAAEETDCQLIVMGTRGNSGLSHVLLGSVAERTLRAAPCSVLAVRAEEDRDS